MGHSLFYPNLITSIHPAYADAPMSNGGRMPMPMIIHHTAKGERGFDPYSRLLSDRIIFLGTPIDDDVSNLVVGLLLALDNDDELHKDAKVIRMFINSPGGVVSSGMAIHDTMRFIRSPVHTYCVGMAASMGAVLFAAGAKGHRYILPHSHVMIHQPLGGARGQVTDMKIQYEQAEIAKEVITNLLVEYTGQSRETIAKDIERDYYLHGQAAVEYCIADKVVDAMPRSGNEKGE